MIEQYKCENEGCSCSKFYLGKYIRDIKITCISCSNSYYANKQISYFFKDGCSKCHNEIFRAYYDIDNNEIYLTCSECGGSPSKVHLDNSGYQIPYEEFIIKSIERKISDLSIKIEELEKIINSSN